MLSMKIEANLCTSENHGSTGMRHPFMRSSPFKFHTADSALQPSLLWVSALPQLFSWAGPWGFMLVVWYYYGYFSNQFSNVGSFSAFSSLSQLCLPAQAQSSKPLISLVHSAHESQCLFSSLGSGVLESRQLNSFNLASSANTVST